VAATGELIQEAKTLRGRIDFGEETDHIKQERLDNHKPDCCPVRLLRHLRRSPQVCSRGKSKGSARGEEAVRPRHFPGKEQAFLAHAPLPSPTRLHLPCSPAPQRSLPRQKGTYPIRRHAFLSLNSPNASKKYLIFERADSHLPSSLFFVKHQRSHKPRSNFRLPPPPRHLGHEATLLTPPQTQSSINSFSNTKASLPSTFLNESTILTSSLNSQLFISSQPTDIIINHVYHRGEGYRRCGHRRQ